MKAVILAGGKGTRLRPYTTVFPKPLVPVGEIPILEIILRQLHRNGIHDVCLSVGYLAELLEAYLERSTGVPRDLRITYVHEEKPTGTAGALTLIDGLDDTFLMMNGDVLTTLNYRKLIDFHAESGAALTISTHRKPVQIDFGVLTADTDDSVTDYIEKPTLDYRVSMGVYVVDPSVIDFVPRDSYFDFPDLVKSLLAAGKKVSAYPSEDLWLDIGRHDDYERAQEIFNDRRGEFGIG